VFCPICGGKLHVDGGKLLCDRHGEMNVYLPRDPAVSAEVARHCDVVGVKDLEAS
jgi:hypothetical protein